MILKWSLLLVLLISCLVSSVSASDDICKFNNSYNLSKSDLPAYFSDQVGCGIQNISDSASILVICTVGFFILIMIYGVFGKR